MSTPTIVIGAPIASPPSTLKAMCETCGDEHKIQPSTQRMLADLNDRATVICWSCLPKADLPPVNFIGGIREGRRHMGMKP